MKKGLFIVVLAGLLAGGVFAEHPGGWGVGVMGSFNVGIGAAGNGGGALSLKIPGIPVFWGLSLGLNTNYFSFGIQGDYYIFDKTLVPDAKLGWYLGGGGFFNYWTWSTSNSGWDNYSHTGINLGARLPIGLSWQPLDFLEVFLEAAPSLGAAIDFGTTYKVNKVEQKTDGGFGLFFTIPASIGIRIWF